VVENRPAPRPEEPIDEAPATQPTPGQPPYNPTWQSGIQSCDAYTRMMAMCIENPKFPDAARQATRDALAQMQQAWGGMVNSGPDALRAISDACVQAIQAMSQAGDAMCPGVFPPAPPARP
jgi:hypothetical protein